MATLAQYSATLHEAAAEQAPGTRTLGFGVRIAGAAIYASVFVLVAVAGLLQAG